MHEPANHSHKFMNGGGKQDSDDGGSFKGLNIDNYDFKTSDGHEDHRKIKEGEEALAFFCYWVIRMSTHDLKVIQI